MLRRALAEGGAALRLHTAIVGRSPRLPAVKPRHRKFTRPSLGGVTLHALHRGEPGNPTLVLLHGGGGNVHWWDDLAVCFADRFHVVALDFRGHGDSDHPDELLVGAFSEDLAALVEDLGGQPPLLVGHSLGGRVALDHAAGRGGVRGLVMLDVARGAPAGLGEATRRTLGIRRSYRSREEAVSRFRFLPEAPNTPEATRCAIAERSVRRDPDGRYGFKFDPRWFGVATRPLPPLDRVACPTLVVRGERSPLLSDEGAKAWVAEIPGSELLVVPDAGHHVHLDRPQDVRGALDRFFGRLERAETASRP